MKSEDYMMIGVILMLLIALIAEISLIGYAFLSADSVECDAVSCIATKERSYSTHSQVCFSNGKPVDCQVIEESVTVRCNGCDVNV